MPGLLGLLMYILHKRYEIYPYQRDMPFIDRLEKNKVMQNKFYNYLSLYAAWRGKFSLRVMQLLTILNQGNIFLLLY